LVNSIEVKNPLPTANATVPSSSVKTGLETSLATALNTTASLGPDAGTVAKAAQVAWMHAFSIASLVAAGIVFVTVVIAFVALPRQNQSESDIHD
jgi:hypothetical protein